MKANGRFMSSCVMLSAALGLTLSAGCASSFKVKQPFPSRERVERLAEAPSPAPETVLTSAPAAVSSWQMVGELPNVSGPAPYQDVTSYDPAISQAVASHPSALNRTAAAQCYAHQYGAFILAHDHSPPTDITAFMSMRCGLAFPDAQAQWFVAQGEDPIKLEPKLYRPAFDAAPKGAEVGFWAGQGNGKSVAIAVVATKRVELAQVPMLVTGNTVEIRGKFPSDKGWVVGYASRGELGYATCVPVPGIPLAPDELALRCPLKTGDPYTIIEIAAADPERVMGDEVLSIMVGPDPVLTTQYVAADLSLPVNPGDYSRASVLAGINSLRQRANMQPMTLASEQSNVVDKLLPHILAPSSSAKQRDEYGLAMLSGYWIDGVIKESSFSVFRGAASWTVARTLGSMLQSPLERALLFDPSNEVLSLGMLEVPKNDARAVAGLAFSMFKPRDFSDEAASIMDELDRQRAKRGLGPVVRVGDESDRIKLAQSADRIRLGKATPPQEAQALAEYFTELTQKSFGYTVMSPMRLKGWRPDFSGQLLEAPNVAAAIQISYFLPEDAAWGQHVVLVLFTLLDGPTQ